ncbi:MAG: type II toxin-antitoxin system VapC family toxin [Flammeovirgaceae bacterium]|nr:MAG: type II toxin-antitoxin system VapC family toxin [Flammeovirgaceae bacterium]
MILCDTNIIIELLKGNSVITNELKKIGQARIAVSSVTVAELMFWALNQSELKKIMRAIHAIQTFHVDEEISVKSLDLIMAYGLSHKLDVPDSLIAATALMKGCRLFTLNVKDFRFIKSLNLYSSS